jgi:hypothetical protein
VLDDEVVVAVDERLDECELAGRRVTPARLRRVAQARQYSLTSHL